MKLKHIFGGQISAVLLLSVPVLALLALSPWTSASQADDVAFVDSVTAGDLVDGESTLTSDSLAIENLSDWQYTGKSAKSAKSEKSKKSPKSDKSKKSKKSKK